jgi:hypothetical protein
MTTLNEKAAKNWLMTRALPWLLIIDNIDDTEINVDDLLPQGIKGRILLTTRNPVHLSCPWISAPRVRAKHPHS